MYTQLLFVIVVVATSCVNGKGIIMDDNRLGVDKTSETIESFELKKIPHRIYLAGHDIIEGFGEPKGNGNSVDMTFTYELVEPTTCQLFKPTFGCCWDNKTVAVGPNGEGCPMCIDKKKSCKKWTEYCHVGTIKEVCPQSCHVCPEKRDSNCRDAEDQKEYCALYSRFGLCKRPQIRSYCKSTCGACSLKANTRLPPKK